MLFDSHDMNSDSINCIPINLFMFITIAVSYQELTNWLVPFPYRAILHSFYALFLCFFCADRLV